MCNLRDLSLFMAGGGASKGHKLFLGSHRYSLVHVTMGHRSTSQTENKSAKAEQILESVYDMDGVMLEERKVDRL